jgi:hypothetical protein
VESGGVSAMEQIVPHGQSHLPDEQYHPVRSAAPILVRPVCEQHGTVLVFEHDFALEAAIESRDVVCRHQCGGKVYGQGVALEAAIESRDVV